MPRQVLFLSPLAAEVVFAGAVAALDAATPQRVGPIFKDMECARFADPSQWADWTLDTEVAAIESLRGGSATDRLDFVGYSGGAAAGLAYAAAHPEVLASLTLIEPPWIGNDVWSDEEAAFRKAYDELADVPGEDVWRGISNLLNAPSTPVPPAPPVDPEDLRTNFMGVWRGYRGAPLNRDLLQRLDLPVYLPVGDGSAARMHAQAECLASCFPNARMETYEGANHFNLPHVQAERLANGLERLWKESP